MKGYIYTLHAKEKLKSEEARKLGITKRDIQRTIENPGVVDTSEEPVYIAISSFTETLSLCVAYRKVERAVRIITFYPAQKGRYERKILQS